MARNFRQLSEAVNRDPERRARVEEHKRAIYDALALADLREAQGVTQSELAASLAMSQANISRIEHEQDVYLSTLEKYVLALGGHLEVTAVFPAHALHLVRTDNSATWRALEPGTPLGELASTGPKTSRDR